MARDGFCLLFVLKVVLPMVFLAACSIILNHFLYRLSIGSMEQVIMFFAFSLCFYKKYVHASLSTAI